jgi:hypothetical protein
MPKSFPRAPLPLLAALLAPLAWQFGRPDLFDSYSAGVILLQVGLWAWVWMCVCVGGGGQG